MAYTVAITNQKGGVGKTTTAVNLAAAIAIAGRRTLLVDADPQGNTTSGVGIAKLELQLSLYDALVEEHPVQDVVLPVPGLPHLSVLPATQDLVGAELQLVERPFREAALRRVLEPLEREYDYIVVDCPPSLGLLTLNVLAAVQALIIPIQCEYYGLEGISQLLNTVRLVQQNINPGLAIGGVLLTMYDSRLNLCRQVAEDATEYFGPKVFGTPIPRNVRLAEAPSFGKPILLYDVQSVGAKSYLAVAQELLRRVEGAEVIIAPAQVSAVAQAAGAHSAAASTVSSETSERAPEESRAAESGTMSDASDASSEDTGSTVVEASAGPGYEGETPAPGYANVDVPAAGAPAAGVDGSGPLVEAVAPGGEAPIAGAAEDQVQAPEAETAGSDVPGTEVTGVPAPEAHPDRREEVGVHPTEAHAPDAHPPDAHPHEAARAMADEGQAHEPHAPAAVEVQSIEEDRAAAASAGVEGSPGEEPATLSEDTEHDEARRSSAVIPDA
jgi:chromosome partitioning protein